MEPINGEIKLPSKRRRYSSFIDLASNRKVPSSLFLQFVLLVCNIGIFPDDIRRLKANTHITDHFINAFLSIVLEMSTTARIKTLSLWLFILYTMILSHIRIDGFRNWTQTCRWKFQKLDDYCYQKATMENINIRAWYVSNFEKLNSVR